MPHNYHTLLRAKTRSLMLYPGCCNEQVSGPYTTHLRDNMLHNNQLVTAPFALATFSASTVSAVAFVDVPITRVFLSTFFGVALTNSLLL